MKTESTEQPKEKKKKKKKKWKEGLESANQNQTLSSSLQKPIPWMIPEF